MKKEKQIKEWFMTHTPDLSSYGNRGYFKAVFDIFRIDVKDVESEGAILYEPTDFADWFNSPDDNDPISDNYVDWKARLMSEKIASDMELSDPEEETVFEFEVDDEITDEEIRMWCVEQIEKVNMKDCESLIHAADDLYLYIKTGAVRKISHKCCKKGGSCEK